MFCPKCGKEVVDDAAICIHCGREIKIERKEKVNKSEDNNISKSGMGVLFALLLGLIGLVIGLLIYPNDTVARKTFIKGWTITFAISAGVAVLAYVIIMVIVVVTHLYY